MLRWAREADIQDETFIIDSECPRFSSGDGKGLIKASIRGDDLFFIVDVGNYNCRYKIFGHENCMSPDDHFQDLKRLIQAASGKAHRVSAVSYTHLDVYKRQSPRCEEEGCMVFRTPEKQDRTVWFWVKIAAAALVLGFGVWLMFFQNISVSLSETELYVTGGVGNLSLIHI